MPFTQPLPEWNKLGTEPPQSKKDVGWVAGDKPPADWLNWLSYRAHQALKELQQNAVHKDDQVAIADASTTQKGITMLEDSTTSTSITKAATPNSVKNVKDSIPALNNTVNSTSTTQGATANSVKIVNDSLTTHTAQYASLAQTGHVQLDSSTNSANETKAATPKAVKLAFDYTDQKTLSIYSEYKSGKDTNGIFTIVDYKTSTGTLAVKQSLSAVDLNGKYTTLTKQFYDATGTTVVLTETYTLTYDTDGDLISGVKV